MRNAETTADTGYHFGLAVAFGTEAMIDARGLDAARPRGCSEEKHCETVRAAGNGHADANIGCDQRIEISSKPLDQSVLGNHPKHP